MNQPRIILQLEQASHGQMAGELTDRTTGIKRGANGSAQPGQPGSPMGAPL